MAMQISGLPGLSVEACREINSSKMGFDFGPDSEARKVRERARIYLSTRPTSAREIMPGELTKNDPGAVYFILNEGTLKIKIGWSKRLVRRLSSLQTANHDTLRILGCIIGTKKDEGWWHQRFADEWISGEWFEPSRRLLRAIRAALEDFCPALDALMKPASSPASPPPQPPI